MKGTGSWQLEVFLRDKVTHKCNTMTKKRAQCPYPPATLVLGKGVADKLLGTLDVGVVGDAEDEIDAALLWQVSWVGEALLTTLGLLS